MAPISDSVLPLATGFFIQERRQGILTWAETKLVGAAKPGRAAFRVWSLSRLYFHLHDACH